MAADTARLSLVRTRHRGSSTTPMRRRIGRVGSEARGVARARLGRGVGTCGAAGRRVRRRWLCHRRPRRDDIRRELFRGDPELAVLIDEVGIVLFLQEDFEHRRRVGPQASDARKGGAG